MCFYNYQIINLIQFMIYEQEDLKLKLMNKEMLFFN